MGPTPLFKRIDSNSIMPAFMVQTNFYEQDRIGFQGLSPANATSAAIAASQNNPRPWRARQYGGFPLRREFPDGLLAMFWKRLTELVARAILGDARK